MPEGCRAPSFTHTPHRSPSASRFVSTLDGPTPRFFRRVPKFPEAYSSESPFSSQQTGFGAHVYFQGLSTGDEGGTGCTLTATNGTERRPVPRSRPRPGSL